MKNEIFDIDAIDFYDYDQLDRLRENRARKWLKLSVQAEKGDPKAKRAIKKHEALDRELKIRASITGYYWG